MTHTLSKSAREEPRTHCVRGSSRALLLILLSLCISCQGRCEPSADTCQPACPEGFLCEASSKRCITTSLPLYERSEIPGRAARINAASGGYLAAVMDPDARQVLTSFRTTSARTWTWRVLSRSLRAGSRHLAIASDSQQSVVVWIDQDGYFQLAVRRTNSGEEAWSNEVVRVAVDDSLTPSYSATDDFDVALDAQGEPYIVFRDRDVGGLMLLERGAMASWQRTLIDDGTDTSTLDDCAPEMREARRRGLGLEPDMVIRSQVIAVVYHDADCGDLRLARRAPASAWTHVVLDRGEREPREDHVTGRYPSLAINEQGQLALSYFDQSYGRLMYGTVESEAFVRQVVDPGLGLAPSSQRPKKIVGAFSHLSFGASGAPQITYLDGSSLDAVVATTSGEPDASGRFVWQQRVVAAQGATGFFLQHARVVGEDALLCIMESLTPSEQGAPGSSVQIIEQEL